MSSSEEQVNVEVENADTISQSSNSSEESSSEKESIMDYAQISKNSNRIIIQCEYLKEDDCALCLDSMKGKSVKYIPCKHCFHMRCFNTMIDSKESNWYKCPLCRFDFSEALRAIGIYVEDYLENDDYEQEDFNIFIEILNRYANGVANANTNANGVANSNNIANTNGVANANRIVGVANQNANQNINTNLNNRGLFIYALLTDATFDTILDTYELMMRDEVANRSSASGSANASAVDPSNNPYSLG